MAFKIYFNKKTRHPSISLSGKDKEKWENLEMTHNPSGDNKYIDIVVLPQKAQVNLMLGNMFVKIDIV